MNDLLTTKQVQDILRVDRTTVYRMLKTGRLAGVKVGNQWRFHQHEVELLLGLAPKSETAVVSQQKPLESLPVNCLQSVQDVCAEIANIGAITTDHNGVPLTNLSNCGQFCALIQSSESGRKACLAAWHKLSQQTDEQPQFATCHAGLQYARARIHLNDIEWSMIIAGQFYTTPPNQSVRDEEIRQLAARHHLDGDQLVEASHNLVLLDNRKQNEITRWLKKVAKAFAEIAQERSDLIGRLKNIAAMSNMGD